jgi:undecaprenyl-diphosphatase
MLEALLEVDTQLFYFFNSTIANDLFDIIMPIITDKHNWIIPIMVITCCLVSFEGKKAWIVLLLLVLAVGSTDLFCFRVLKPLVRRPRPSHVLEDARVLGGKRGRKGFPSNHAANITAAMTILAYFYRRFLYGAIFIAVIVSFSRIYVGVHYPLDVIAGAAIGALISYLWLRLWREMGKRRYPKILFTPAKPE